MSINWDEMPEWADVWIEDLEDYYLGGWHKYCEDEDRYYDVNGLYYSSGHGSIIIHYPPKNKPKWNGVGLPPVGTVCELSNCGRDYEEVEILFTSNTYCIVKYEQCREQHYYWSSIKFRPIKPDKEKWIEKAVNIYFSRTPCDKLDRFGLLYDALISGELPIPRGDKL